MCAPTSWAARRLVSRLPDVSVLPARGFGPGEEESAAWAGRRGQRRLLMEDFYREARERLNILMDSGGPSGGRWNFDAENQTPTGRVTCRWPVRKALVRQLIGWRDYVWNLYWHFGDDYGPASSG